MMFTANCPIAANTTELEQKPTAMPGISTKIQEIYY
jgi:hypothetical protein